MPRKRMIDPRIWESEQAMSLDPAAFKLYVYFISHADDEGRMRISPAMVRPRAYPLDPDVSVEDVDKFIHTMADIGLILVYENHSGTCLQHPNWSRFQTINKPTPSCIPAPLPEDYGSTTEPLPPKGREEKGIEEKEEYAQSVHMTEAEHGKLVAQYGKATTEDYIARLSHYKLSQGKRYKSDYHTILAWMRKDGVKPKKVKPTCKVCGDELVDGMCLRCADG